MNRQVYYRAIKSKTHRQLIAGQVLSLVRSIRNLMPRLGTRKLYHMLRAELSKINVGRDKLFRILKANHMLITPKKRYHITTDSHHRFRKYKNSVSEIEFKRPEQVWVSDITYTGNRKNPSYLALVTDAYSKKIMGYDLSASLEVGGSLRALEMAFKKRSYENRPLIHHSDRGLQYCSNEYQQLLKDRFVSTSMTEKYDPYENAIAERVNGILKQEFSIAAFDTNLVTKKLIVKDAINLYNSLRPHLSNHMLTPDKMHKQQKLKRKQYKSKKLNNESHCSA
ncbi:IS3 family transposase [Christiangramia fulva]|uniref:IS3 family transposase n=1 Tax=Christiangramia fulva TaxID=2126553 RepID=UPI001F02902C|nr:IS3 family transposase [Christiangramia fulva]